MATSTKQREANRRNALKSTGPRTEAGKARSRRSGIKHGAYCQDEVPDSLQHLYERRMAAWANPDAPRGDCRERAVLHDAVMASLRRDAARRALAARAERRHRGVLLRWQDRDEKVLAGALEAHRSDPVAGEALLEDLAEGRALLAANWGHALRLLERWAGAGPMPRDLLERLVGLFHYRPDDEDEGWADLNENFAAKAPEPADLAELMEVVAGRLAEHEAAARELRREDEALLAEELAIRGADDTARAAGWTRRPWPTPARCGPASIGSTACTASAGGVRRGPAGAGPRGCSGGSRRCWPTWRRWPRPPRGPKPFRRRKSEKCQEITSTERTTNSAPRGARSAAPRRAPWRRWWRR
jgi:hypothetical protein